jgi:hypothetical protein
MLRQNTSVREPRFRVERGTFFFSPPPPNIYSLGLRFVAPENGEIQGKYVGGLAEGTHVTAATRTSGRVW